MVVMGAKGISNTGLPALVEGELVSGSSRRRDRRRSVNSLAAQPARGSSVETGEATARELKAQRSAAIDLLRSWIREDVAACEVADSWNELKQELDRDRDSSRRLFP